jgi:uncharacterized membrane protein YebE (DUF533 family)
MLGSFLGNRGGVAGQGRSSGLADMARDFLGKEQAGGMSGAKIGGLGALAGGLLGGGIGGAAKGGAMAVLGTLALKAWQDHQGQQQGQPGPVSGDVKAMSSPQTERMVLQAMIGAAQADGHLDEQEMTKILGQMGDDEVTEEERQLVRKLVGQPVDLVQLGASVNRPEIATEIYLAALLAIDVDTLSEREYLRQLANALRLDRDVVQRLHGLTGAPAADQV